jgi:arabinose-5-phosphate isomerase
MALVPPGMAVREVLHEMSSRRAGAAIVVDDLGKLLGIFTHSDFARHFQANPGLGGLPVEQFITRHPVTIQGDHLAVEVLRVIEERKIDDLIVVDETNTPIGVVDSQDLARFKLI